MRIDILQKDFELITRTVEGRRFVYQLIEFAGQEYSSYRDHNAEGTSFCEGKRAMALHLLGLFKRSYHSRQNYLEMMKENYLIAEEQDDVSDEVVGLTQLNDVRP